MAITIDDVRSKVITLEDVHRLLDKTEPLSITRIDKDTDIKFHMEPDWAMGLEAIDNTDPVEVTMTIGGVERRLTKEAVLQAGANHGLLRPYMKKIPAALTNRLLNYHYGQGMGDEEFNTLVVGDNISAFTPTTITPFSTRQLLDNVVAGIQNKMGSDVPIFADYKIANSLQRTDVRLILPTRERDIQDGDMEDVPADATDVWFHGIHLSNSLVGKSQTTLDAYLFRYWCTNGCTTTAETGTWSRRINGQQDDIYDWARTQVDEVLDGLDFELDQIQALTKLDISGNTPEVLRQIYDEYKMPVSQRADIEQPLLSARSRTLYTLLNAVTGAANSPDLTDARRDTLMRIGGAIPTDTFDTMKAKIWSEGHTADEAARNPYAIRQVA